MKVYAVGYEETRSVVIAIAVATLLAKAGHVSAAGVGASAVGRLPLPYRGDARQVVTVVGATASSTTATLTAWQRARSGWVPMVGPVMAYVGSNGIGQAREATSHTPAGVWTLTEAFGIQPNNGTRLPYRQVTTLDWWVSDTNSPYYNTYYHCDHATPCHSTRPPVRISARPAPAMAMRRSSTTTARRWFLELVRRSSCTSRTASQPRDASLFPVTTWTLSCAGSTRPSTQ